MAIPRLVDTVTTMSVREHLLDERRRVAAQVGALTREFDDIVEAAAFVATDDEHDPEGHTIAFERQQVAALRREAQLHLADLDDAISRVDDGTYGRCAVCGGAIAEERLAALPGTRTCIDCAR